MENGRNLVFGFCDWISKLSAKYFLHCPPPVSLFYSICIIFISNKHGDDIQSSEAQILQEKFERAEIKMFLALGKEEGVIVSSGESAGNAMQTQQISDV